MKKEYDYYTICDYCGCPKNVRVTEDGDNICQSCDEEKEDENRN